MYGPGGTPNQVRTAVMIAVMALVSIGPSKGDGAGL
jgi:hypothetical protein